MATGFAFNPPPGWPKPPVGWTPPENWAPDPSWPAAPPGWTFWVQEAAPTDPPTQPEAETEQQATQPATPEDPSPVAAAPTPEQEPSVDRLLLTEELRRRREAEAQVRALTAQLAATEAETARLVAQATAATPASASTSDVIELDDERVLQEVGIYRYHHPLENSEEFRNRLRDLQNRVNESVKQGDAIIASDMFTFNNSLAKGRRMTTDLSKLMLRAYNAEADNCVRSLRAGNVITAKKRLEASVTSIARLGAMMEMHVNPSYHAMRLEEIELTADFLMKVQEEREEAREERERLREERKAEQELAAERERLDKERSHYLNAIEALRKSGDDAAIEELASKLEGLDAAIAQNDFRAANIRAGYVYVISNRGAFGHNMVKIGLTRRLEPLDRVRELGDASFPFDVHALFFSDDAVTLENQLHRSFSDRRVNHVNERREFFFATPQEVREVLAEKVGSLLEFTDDPESTQYLQSKKYWPATS